MTILEQAGPREEAVAPRAAEVVPGVQANATVPQRRYLRDESPWVLRHVVTSIVITGVGVLGAFACWYGASGEVTLHDQTGWLVGELASATLFGVGMAAGLIAGFREVRLGQRELFADIAAVFELPSGGRRSAAVMPPVASAEEAATGPIATVLVTAPGMTRVHQVGCPLVAGKSVAAISWPAAQERGLGRCGVCLP